MTPPLRPTPVTLGPPSPDARHAPAEAGTRLDHPRRLFADQDVPGVVGRIGTLCGRHGINIAGMQLGRERRGGGAVSILNLDDPMPPAALDEIRAMPDIVFARLVRL